MENDRTRQPLSEFNDLYKKYDELYRDIAKTFGLSDCAFWILYSIREADTILTQSDICSALYQPKQTVNSALKKLEAEGYITLQKNGDRRSKQLFLTEKGRSLAAGSVDRVLAAEASALSGFSKKERETFFCLFQKYICLTDTNLQKIKADLPVSRERNQT